MRSVLMLPIAVFALSGCQQDALIAPDTEVVNDMLRVSEPPLIPELPGVEVPVNIRPEAEGRGDIMVRGNSLLAVALEPGGPVDIADTDVEDENTDGVQPSSVKFTAYYAETSVSIENTVHDLQRPQAFQNHLKVTVDPETGAIEILYLVFHFHPDELAPGSIQGCITGTNQRGEPFWGCEAVLVR